MNARVTVFLLAAISASAQSSGPATDAAVSGVVKDAVTGEPLANFNVSTYLGVTWVGNTVVMPGSSRQLNSVTDENGRYRLAGLPPGPYRIQARSAETFGSPLTRRITVAGHDLENIDFLVKVGGTISGRVLDENKEPVPDMDVVLISREYYHGALGYLYREIARTDDRGQYKLHRVEADKPYLVMAEKRSVRLPARSDVPLNPKLRRRAVMRTFYPSSPDKEGGVFLTLRPRENREGADIELKKSQSYCIDGVLSGASGPGAVTFGIQGMQPSTGMSNGGGMSGPPPGGQAGPDGKFRICDLNPGVYRFSVMDRVVMFNDPNQSVNLGMELVTVGDEDLHNLRISTKPFGIEGEAVLDGPAPDPPVPGRVNVSLDPLLRGALPGEKTNAPVDVPGSFSLSGLVPSDYGVRVLVRTKGRYVKDATYGGHSVMFEPMHLGEVQGGTLRVVIGQDGAAFTASVSDKDGNPVPEARVIAIPADVNSDAALQAALVEGETDQLGQYTSPTIAPGKYFIGATFDEVDATPESIARLRKARERFYEVDLAPNASASVPLKVLSLK